MYIQTHISRRQEVLLNLSLC